MTSKARRRSAITAAVLVVIVLALYFAGPWALRKWAVDHFSQTLQAPVALDRLSFNPFTATAHFEGLRLGASDSPVLTVDSGRARFQWSTLWQSGVHIAAVQLGSPHLRLVSPSSGPLNITRLGGQPAAPPAPLTVERIAARNGRIDWIDRRSDSSAELSVTGVDITLNDYSRLGAAPMQGSASGTLGDGTLELQGSLGFAPFTADLSLSARQVALSIFPPLVTRNLPVQVNGGTLSADGDLTLGSAAETALGYQGGLQLDALSLVSQSGQPLLNVASAALSQIDLVLGDHLRIGRSELNGPELTALIDEDGSFNLATALGGSTAGANSGGNRSATSGGSGGGTALSLARLEVSDGRFHFEDRNMSPTVSLDVESLQGQLTGLDMSSGGAADYRFEGRESDNTPVMIEGSIDTGTPLMARMHLTTEQLTLEQFAPYIRQFAGYRIEQGVADLDLDYRLRDGTLTASNHIILRRLDLGQQVDQDASGLPLKNLIALLQAENGTINLDIPIETGVNGSSVDISAVVWQAIRESLENLITSPIDTLQALIGGSEEEGSGEASGSSDGSGESGDSQNSGAQGDGQGGTSESVDPAADGYQGGPLSGVRANPAD